MNACDSFLLRLPLAGVGLHTYDDQWRGQVCKIANVVCRIATLVLAILLTTNVMPLTYTYLAILGVASTSFLFFVNGSDGKRRAAEILFELSVTAVAMALVILAAIGTLSPVEAGLGVMGTLFGSTLVGGYANRGKIETIPLVLHNNEHPLVQEEHLESMLSPKPTRALDHVVGLARDAGHLSMSLLSSITHQDHYGDTISQHDSQALCVLVHGLVSLPAYLDGYHDALSKHQKNITIFQPYVTENGLCGLKTAAANIKAEVKTWADAHPKCPIIWIGHSNGARIVGTLSAELKLEGALNPMQVHCIAGPFYGSEFVNRPDWPQALQTGWTDLFKKLYPMEVYEELSWKSDCATTVIQQMQKVGDKHADLNYKFYATATDMVVFPFTSALPAIPNAEYFIAASEGHLGILTAVQDRIVQDAVQFIDLSISSNY